MQSANITDSFQLMRNQKSILIDSQIYLFRVVVVVSPAFSRDTNQKMKHGLHREPRIGLSRIFLWYYWANDSWILVWIQLDLQVLGHFLFRYALRCTMVIGHLLPIAFSPLSFSTPSWPSQRKELVTLPMNFSPLSFSPVGEMLITPDIDNQLIITTESNQSLPYGGG